ncbi:thioredoxin domain-containing protein 17-like [Clavelina lepadiformis]|uniref:thioredoxin domain-containing protein 17-like n=1 Tax=Clavelina lepadiformis TaxID=159417 RepID=UPI004041EADE
MKEIKAHGFAEFMKIVSSDDLKGKAIFCLFCGDKDANGKSWCPDCVVSEPVVRSSLDQLDDPDAVFVYCAVGGREYWKDQRNEFRQNLKLTGVPTLMKWGKPNQKLVEKEIKADLIAMMLESED